MPRSASMALPRACHEIRPPVTWAGTPPSSRSTWGGREAARRSRPRTGLPDRPLRRWRDHLSRIRRCRHSVTTLVPSSDLRILTDRMRQKTTCILALSLALTLPLLAADTTKPKAAAARKTTTTAARSNPFLTKSALLYQAPPFNRIKDSDFQPAIEKGMTVNRAEIEKIANSSAAPTFANTIEVMERSGALLTRAAKIFFALAQSNTNDTLQKVEAEEAPKLAAHQDAVYLNPKLFARVKAIYDTRDSLGAEEKFLTERYYRNFIRAGAQLNQHDN